MLEIRRRFDGKNRMIEREKVKFPAGSEASELLSRLRAGAENRANR